MEEIENICCKFEFPFMESHHDLIVSKFYIPGEPVEPSPPARTQPAGISNTRKRIVWNDESIIKYQEVLSDTLSCLRKRWLDPASKSSVSLLLKLTSDVLSSAASSTNDTIALSEAKEVKSKKIPKDIKRSLNTLKRKSKVYKRFSNSSPLYSSIRNTDLKVAKANHRKTLRRFREAGCTAHAKKMFSFLSSGGPVYKKIRSLKASSVEQIQFLKVGNEIFHGNDVKIGFYDSIHNLKTNTNANEEMRNGVIDYREDYKNILDICKNKRDLPNITLVQSTKIINQMKPQVNDFYSISTRHYINAGKAGLEHFNYLLNAIIDDVNLASIEELNSCYALLLHKGHGKPRTVDKSYRTISTCPMLSKALDLYIHDLHVDKWNLQQAPTQYQGEGSSHELASLLVTEIVQHSLYTLKEPVYLLCLDAQSAFDAVVLELLVRNLYLAGMDGNTTNFMDHRLTNRLTYLDWDRNIMGPIKDEKGLEQGGGNSSELYKLYNNDQLKIAQNSGQGVDLGNCLLISAVGLADDGVLSSNKISKLSNILYLTVDYCKKYSVTLCADKTRLLRLTTPAMDPTNMEMFNPIIIQGKHIDFSEEAEHVGVIRSVNGNLPNTLRRISAHRKALGATLSSGIAMKQRVNPMVGIRLEKIYGTPVLMSGLASLVMTDSEVAMIDKHYKNTYQNIQKLLPATPNCVVCFLGGCLPAQAVLHMKQLTLFGMVARLQNDPLNIHARNILVAAKSSSKSWFCQIRNICLMYFLPHPLQILDNPPKNEVFKSLIKSHIVDHWEKKFRGEANLLPSLKFFKTHFMSLTKPHPIWSSLGSNPYEAAKAVQQARFLSGRYRSESLAKHWSKNPNGFCLNPDCLEKEVVETVLVHYNAYNQSKKNLFALWLSTSNPVVYGLVLEAFLNTSDYLVQFLLDCSCLPSVIAATQLHGVQIIEELFYLTRTWCFSIHRQRMRMLGRWNFQ